MSDTAEDLKPTEAPRPGPDYKPAGPWVVQYRVLKSIILRDMGAQYGEYRMGYLMGILMPLASIGFIMFMFNLRGKIAPSDFPLLVFLITGYPVWWAFQQTYTKTLRTAGKADSLLAFPQITQLDLIVAGAVLDAATNTIVFALSILIVAVVANAPPADPGAVLILYWAMTWTGVNVGLMLSALQRIAPSVVTFLNMGVRMLMWVSGVIYTVDRLPPAVWPYLQWNPLLHIIEGIRHAWVPGYQPPIFDPIYVVVLNVVMTMLGLAIERATRRHVGA